MTGCRRQDAPREYGAPTTAWQVQRMNCLPVDKAALWLAGVETNSVELGLRAKIEMYQEELAPVAIQRNHEFATHGMSSCNGVLASDT
jgi:hypothetical protein